MRMNEDRFLKIAKQAALEAGKIISGYFGGSHEYNFKNEDSSGYRPNRYSDNRGCVYSYANPDIKIQIKIGGQLEKKIN